jgi:integrase
MLAREFESKRMREVREGRSYQEIGFEDFAKMFLKLHASRLKSQKFYEWTIKVLVRHFGSKPLSHIGVKEVQEFAVMRRSKVSPATTNRSLGVLKTMFNRAIDWGYVMENPVRRVKMERERNRREYFLSADQAAELLKAVPRPIHPIVVAALHTGGRRSELLNLDWEDVDLRSNTIHFRDTKGGGDRAVPVDRTLGSVLRALPSRLAGGPVFLGRSGRLTRDELRSGFEKGVKKAGLPGLRFHDLRHSYASFLARAGVPLNTIRELLGHRTLEMTLRYSRLSPDHKREAVTVLDQLLRKRSPQKSPQRFGA